MGQTEFYPLTGRIQMDILIIIAFLFLYDITILVQVLNHLGYGPLGPDPFFCQFRNRLALVMMVNIIGVKNASIVQQVLVVCLMIALAVFTAFGIFRVDFKAYVQPQGFLTDGPLGFCSAAAILTFACGGAQNIINFSAEAKDPTKDMPFVIILSTVVVAVFYAFMAVVATGVLPIDVVQGQPLSLVAAEILPGPLYVFFLIGGAMFALMTTLNAQMGWCTKPLLQGCVDGWLPKKFGAINSRFKTPHNLILFFYLVGLLPLIFGFNMNTT